MTGNSRRIFQLILTASNRSRYSLTKSFSKSASSNRGNMDLFDQYYKTRPANDQGIQKQLKDKKNKWSNYLEKRYGEEQRHYHTMKHLEDMSLLWHNYRARLGSPQLVALAILFHDVIYYPKEGDNEEKSDDVFKEFAQDISIPNDETAKVSEWIIATKKHKTPAHLSETPGNDDVHYFLDFDMAILGREKQGYASYARQIRQEYIHIPDQDYLIGRAKVLTDFLKVPFIYATAEFRDKYEVMARDNIGNEIRALESGSFV